MTGPEPGGRAGGEMPAEVRAWVVAVLDQVVSWRLAPRQWNRVLEYLDEMRLEAPGALRTVAEELASADPDAAESRRVTRIGVDAPVEPTPAVRERVNQLIHALGGEVTAAAPASPPAPAGSPAPAALLGQQATPADILDQELVVYVFAPVDGPRADEALRTVHGMWRRYREVCDATEPIPAVGVPVGLPLERGALPAVPVIAAQQDADSGYQALLGRDQDVLILSMLFAARPEWSPSGWPAADARCDTILAGNHDALLGVARLYLGKTAHRHVIAGGAYLRDLVVREQLPAADDRPERRIAVLAPPDQDAELSAWVWSRGGPGLTVLPRYLMHAAKVRYELRVRGAVRPAPSLARQARDAVKAAGGIRRGSDLVRAVRDEIMLTVADLHDMRLTIHIAQANMAAALDPVRPEALAGDDLFTDDRRLAETLIQHIDDDLTYLENAQQLTTHALATPGAATDEGPEPTVGIVTALPEEFAAVQALLREPNRATVTDDPADYLRAWLPSLDPQRPHEVLLTVLGQTGNDAAAHGCANLIRSFPTVGQILMVGIAAGVPCPDQPERHVSLGDIVVATWGIVDFDHVMETDDGPRLRQPFPRPSQFLTRRAKLLEAGEQAGVRPWERWLEEAVRRLPGFTRPVGDADALPQVHYGRIGSADRSLRSGAVRDALADRYTLRAIEMEGKGVGNAAFASGRDWLVVRGISDYGDRHTSRVWRRYAAAVAAAYTAALLAECPPIAAAGDRH
jgi:nucleoside phosphorylase